MTELHETPTSHWKHSHAVQEGDVYVTESGEEWQVTTVEESGNVRVRRLDEGRRGPDDRDSWSEEAVRKSLAFQEIERKKGGLSHELASY